MDFKSLLDNIEFKRQLSLISTFKSNIELSIEYFGKDRMPKDEYMFNEKLEEKLNKIELKLYKFVGEIIKEQAKGEDIEI